MGLGRGRGGEEYIIRKELFEVKRFNFWLRSYFCLVEEYATGREKWCKSKSVPRLFFFFKLDEAISYLRFHRFIQVLIKDLFFFK